MKNIKQLLLTALILALSFSFNVALAAAFTVTTTSDSGADSLRQAILDEVREGITMDEGGQIIIQFGITILNLDGAELRINYINI